MIVNRLNRRADLVGKKDVAFTTPKVILQAFVGAVAGAAFVSKPAGL